MGHKFFFLCPAIPEVTDHLKDLLGRGHTCLFSTQQSILLGNSLGYKDHGIIRDPREHLVLLYSAKKKLRVGSLFMLGFLRTVLATLIQTLTK